MTDKEFKRLSRAQMIEIIYQLQLQIDKMNEEKKELEIKLKDKRLRLNKAGNIAEAALEINDFFRNAQSAADQYLNEIKAIRDEAEAEKQRIIAEAKITALAIMSDAKKVRRGYGSAKETILIEHEKSHSDNG